MTLTKYGNDVLIAVAIIAAVLLALALWNDVIWIKWVLIIIAIFLVAFSLNFFRDPDRQIAAGGRNIDSLIVSPADGEVVIVKEVDEPEFLKGNAKLISIFMSPLDVHVNRSPASGSVEYFRYIEGEFLNASTEASTYRNERALIGLVSHGHKILMAQVAGYIARRIICPVKVGDSLEAGKRFGMIRFGSRVDLWLPVESRISIKVGDHVTAGETVLAELP